MVQPFTILTMALSGRAVVAGVVFVASAGLIGMWYVLSVSMRQQLIPSHLFGRVHGARRTIVKLPRTRATAVAVAGQPPEEELANIGSSASVV